MIKQTAGSIDIEECLDFLWMEITERCNLECVHCYANSGPQAQRTGKMSASDWERVMDEALQLGCKNVQFIGGEPITHPEFKRLLRYACTRFDFIEVFSNLTALPWEILEIMKEYSIHLATSVYSHIQSKHDAITQRYNSFSATIGNLKSVVTEGIPVRAAIIAMESNEGDVEETKNFLEIMGVHDIRVDYVRAIGRGNQSNSRDSIDSLCGRCWQGSLTVNSDGDAYPCIMSEFMPVGNVINNGLSSIIFGERLKTKRKAIRNHHADHKFEAACPPQHQCMPWNPPCHPRQTCNPR